MNREPAGGLFEYGLAYTGGLNEKASLVRGSLFVRLAYGFWHQNPTLAVRIAIQ